MIYGTMVRVLRGGPSIAPALVAPIGIHDGSRCWGVWVPNSKEPVADLVISAIHPNRWPFTFRIELKVLDRVGAMADVAALLRENQVNIIFTQCTPSGHTHATWNLIGEALDVAQRIDALEVPPDKLWQLARYLVVDKLRRLEEVLRAANTEARFLYTKFEDEGSDLEFRDDDVAHYLGVSLDEIAAVRKESAKQRTRAIVHRVTAHLAYIRSLAAAKAITELRYDAVYGRLRDTNNSFRTAAETIFGEDILPTDAVFTVEPQEHYLRLRLLPRDRQQRLVAIHCGYDAQFTGGVAVPKSTLGSLAELTRALGTQRVNLLEMSNSLSSRDEDRETGIIKLVGVDPSDPLDRARCEALEVSLRGVQFANHNPRVRVRPFRNSYIFVSRRQDSDGRELPFHQKLGNALQRTARELAIELRTTQIKVGSPDRQMVEDINECDAFLQILTLRDGEAPETAGLGWMISEYAIAEALRKPTVRLCAVDGPMTRDRWAALLGFSICSLTPFPVDANDGELAETFEDALTQLKHNS